MVMNPVGELLEAHRAEQQRCGTVGRSRPRPRLVKCVHRVIR